MKRTNSGGNDRGGGGIKRQRNSDGYAEALAEGKFELRFLLPTKCAGAVIGRGGEKIKSIREKVCNWLMIFWLLRLAFLTVYLVQPHSSFSNGYYFSV